MQREDQAPRDASQTEPEEPANRPIDRGDERSDSSDRLTGGYGGDPENVEDESER